MGWLFIALLGSHLIPFHLRSKVCATAPLARPSQSIACSKRRLRDLYRVIYLPSKDDLEEVDIGLSMLGVTPTLDKEIYDKLTDAGKNSNKIRPILHQRVMKNRLLSVPLFHKNRILGSPEMATYQ